ncbi:MAG: SUMF1/EgtB/PvdO family nonheme iron enzyme [Betaproteobacteria bacterium]|nr:SUMF1/EgtB/PvdO family nonheme iron enzyme [Betaproteobacteria bacterium]
MNDLGAERQAVKEALGGECIVVESYSADERSVRESCLADVAGCDLYIGIVGLRYGFIPPGQEHSITELEYREADRHAVPRLMFLKDEEAVPYARTDAKTKENPPERIEAFRKLVSSGVDGAPRAALFKTPDDLESHVLKAYYRRAARKGEPQPRPITGRPYPGMRAFRTAEADRFFGREAEIESLAERLLVRDEPFLALIGASGSGKSSLVYAGLIPILGDISRTGGVPWRVVSFSPRELGDDPFLALANALGRAFPDPAWRVPDLARRLRDQPAEIVPVSEEALGSGAALSRLLLFADQFEELFAAAVAPAHREGLFQLLAAAVKSPHLRPVIAMRSDFYSHWPQDEVSVGLLRAGHFPVGVPGREALKEAIVGPARAAGLTVPATLVKRILDETGTAPGALALVEFTLDKLYDNRRDNTLTEEAYQTVGGVPGAIDTLAREALTAAGAAASADGLAPLFLAITSVEERDQDLVVVRRRAPKSELSLAAAALADCLEEKRLLMSSGGEGRQPAVIEVAHEALFTHWARFQQWFADYRGDLAARRQVEQAARQWANARRDPLLLWGWERQKPAVEALFKLGQRAALERDPDITDDGIARYRALTLGESALQEPLRAFLHPEPLRLLERLGDDATTHQQREEIGLRLKHIGDPRPNLGLDAAGLPDIRWLPIDAGKVTLETGKAFPVKPFPVKPFHLARYPVTWPQYQAFLDAYDGYRVESWWEGRPREDAPGAPLWSYPNYPAVNVSWYDAMAYCRWLSVRLGFEVRLPTEWEWQWAAAGKDHQEYPWAGEWNDARANSSNSGIGRTVAAGMYPKGRSKFGVDDMAGNVWEWCLNEYEKPGNVSTEGDVARVVRGGSWSLNPGLCRAASRGFRHPDDRFVLIGFRVCCSSPIE